MDCNDSLKIADAEPNIESLWMYQYNKCGNVKKKVIDWK